MGKETASRILLHQERIGRQHRLPLSKAIELSVKSLRVRFWRSLITTGGVVLAIAFLIWIWTDNRVINIMTDYADAPAFDYSGTRDGQAVDGRIEAENAAAARRTLSEAGVSVTELKADPGPDQVRRRLQKLGFSANLSPREKEARQTTYIWLVILSLMVATVGIINAMLMSVTERFREIGTMKCLGALDTFIVKLFLLESSFQGALGTAIGIGIGLLLNLAWNTRRFGGYLFLHLGDLVAPVGLYVLYALGIGVALSMIGAIYPALLAARMEPVVAMRVDA